MTRVLVLVVGGSLVGVLGSAGCTLQPLEDAESAKVVSVQPIPLVRERTVQAGQAVKLALQVLDRDEAGIDGVECFFATSEPDRLIFDTSASAESTQRVLTKRASVDSIQAHGLAVAELTVLDVTEPSSVRVWAGVASAQSVADGAEGSALQVWEFTVHVEPAMAQDGGAP